VRHFKNHPIYGISIRRSGKKWSCKGLVFDALDQVTEIKRLECAELTFASEDEAREHGLNLCKKWIDEQSGEIDQVG
jgi:hypothetical protein